MGLGVGHGLILPLQAGLNEPVDGMEGDLFPGIPKLATVDGDLPVQQKGDQAIARVLLGIGFAGDQVINLGQDIADIEGCEDPPAAFFVAGGVMVDFKIMGIGEVTS